ncbi:D-alanyl-D-alanine carboxypeptidase family protein [Oceanomicrobium pacificus]|uniref:D-alanyl-D-alanine carboxypeptidase n=1 Tax=Oceanomicrobium pacificus TaxID=2692916 RepID=A0A6B0U0R1_9RHOB|nr:D-alanyl-D-alanine carboxypeptidase family protein [Oceanomicrobium pacificus]MXU66823.1 D-alanyl-D-alanine carboxypeptidase [Oceanomicrobium pacificus]
MTVQAARRFGLALVISLFATVAGAAPYAALVMDARSGKVYHSENADTRLHPASLTKMMTLYIVFQEIRAGRMSLDQKVTISRYAAGKPPSKLGLRPGQKIALRYLIRACAVKSANDAAAALAEAVSGSESAFGVKMTEVGRAIGMKKTTFKNASGLTQSGHLSTARDMAILGRQLFYDFPEYYNLFSRRSTSAGIKTVYNTNRRLLDAYRGADGIKTGYTNAAGSNLVASAERGSERIIVSLFGGSSSAARNKRVAELLDYGFRKAPSRVAIARPATINYRAVAGAHRAVTAIAAAARSQRPIPRPAAFMSPSGNVQLAALDTGSTATPTAVAAVQTTSGQPATVTDAVAQVMQVAMVSQDGRDLRPNQTPAPAISAEVREEVDKAVAVAVATMPDGPDFPLGRPIPRGGVRVASAAATVSLPQIQPEEPQVARQSGDSWAVQIGAYNTRNKAERSLVITALQDLQALEGATRSVKPAVVRGTQLYQARFDGLTEDKAMKACERLRARASNCEMIAPGG